MKRTILFLTLLLTVCLTPAEAKTLVAYYSYTGNCKAIAHALTSQIAADVLEIQPAEKGLRYEANDYAVGTQQLNASYGADCIEGDCPAGTLALFSPWGNIVMYYGAASRYSGLYILGKATEGADNIRNLTGTIRVEAVGGTSAIQSTKAENAETPIGDYSLNGMAAREGQAGLIIKSGKKILVKDAQP